jgi:ATP-dependent Clp protease adaptor protein ClpS
MNRERDFEENSNIKNSPSSGKDYTLFLYNDDVHDFAYVIESLIDVCEHEQVQAEQCTYLVHYRGSCDIKKGKYDYLKAMFDQLIEKGLTVSLN